MPGVGGDRVRYLDRAARHQHEPRVGKPGLGEPGLQQTQRMLGLGVRSRGRRRLVVVALPVEARENQGRNVRGGEYREIRGAGHVHMCVRAQSGLGGEFAPFDPEEPVTPAGPGNRREVHRSQGEGLGFGHQCVGGVGDHQPVLCGQVDPYRVGSRGVHGEVPPCEREDGGRFAPGQHRQQHCLGRRVQQRRMQRELLRIRARFFWEHDLRENLVRRRPSNPQPLESRPVRVSVPGETVIKFIEWQWCSADRRPRCVGH